MSESEKIDWKKLRERIAEGPIYPMVKDNPNKRKKPKTLEEIEEYRAKERKRNKEYREKNPDKVHAMEKRWRHENPDKVKAKKKRFYEKHKQDPVWLEKKRARQRDYKRRKKLQKSL